MKRWLLHLIQRIPSVREVFEQNDSLRSQIRLLKTELTRKADEAASSGIASPPDFWVPPGHFYSPLVDPLEDAVQRATDSEANPETPLDHFGIDEQLLLQ